MTNTDITVNIVVPKAMGCSESLVAPYDSTILDVIRNIDQPFIIDKVIKNEKEFNKFILVYLNEERIKDPMIQLRKDSNIEIVIPMAGG